MANFKDMIKQREAGKEFEQHKIIKKFISSLPNPISKSFYKSVLLKYFMFIDKNLDEFDFMVTPGMGFFVDVEEDTYWYGEG